MKWSKFKVRVPVITAVLLITAQSLWANLVGTTGASFLKIGIGARPTAMGGAFIGANGAMDAFHWNPASLFALDDRNLEYSHTEWFQGIRYESIRYVQPYTDKINLGGSVDFLYMGDIEGWTVNQYGIPQSRLTFGASDLLLNFSLSYKYRENLINGWNLKLFREKIYNKSGYGFAIDVGWLLKAGTGEWLRKIQFPNWLRWMHLEKLQKVYPEQAGFVIRNLGSMSALDKQSFPLPTSLGLGISRTFFKNDPVHKLLYNLDVNIPYYKAMYMNFGLEYGYKDLLFLRGGFRTDRQLGFLSKLSFGFGLYLKQYRDLHFDYSFASFGALGITHQISLTIKIGEYKKELLRGKVRPSKAERARKKYEEYMEKAKELEGKNELKQAVKYYIKASKIKSTNELYSKIAELYKELGDEKTAKEYMEKAGITPAVSPEKAGAEKKKPAPSVQQLLKAADEAMQQGDLAKAEELLKKSLEIRETADAHRKLGDLYMQQGDIEKATEEYDKAEKLPAAAEIEKKPETPAVKAPEQMAEWDKLVASAKEKEGAGDIAGAVELLEQAIKIKPTAEIYEKLGDLYLQLGEIDKSSAAYNKADELKQQQPSKAVQPPAEKAETVPAAPEKTEAPSAAAEEHYTELISQAKKAADAGDYQNAISLVNEAIKIKDTPEAHELLGNIYLNMGDIEKSTAEFDKASNLKQKLQYQETSSKAGTAAVIPAQKKIQKQVMVKDLMAKAQTAQNSGDLTSAVKYLNQAISIEDKAELHELLGNIYIQMGDAEKAAKEFEKATALKKQKTAAAESKEEAKKKQQIEALLKQAEEAEKSQDYQTAIDLIKKALAVKDEPKLHEKLGNLYLEIGDSDKAALEFEKALK